MKRSRAIYATALAIVIVVGLTSRTFPSAFPQFAAEYAGDTLWALTIFLLIGFIRPRATSANAAAVALCVAFAVEFSQLYEANWIEALRNTTLGKLTLGSGFLWSDLICYTVGITIGAASEQLFAWHKKGRAVSAQAASIFALLTILSMAPAHSNHGIPSRSQSGVTLITLWGRQGSAPGEFHFPIGIAINKRDEVFVTDHYNNRVQKFDRDGKLIAVIPVLDNPGGIAVAGDGTLFLTHFPASRLGDEKMPDRVSVYDSVGTLLREWGRSGKGDGELDFSGGLAISNSGWVYVADQTNRRVQVFDRNGTFLFKWGAFGNGLGEFGGSSNPKSRVGGPQFVTIDRLGNVYTTEASPPRVQKFDRNGKFLLAWGDSLDAPGGFGRAASGTGLSGPIALCMGRNDTLWVSAAGGRVQCFSLGGRCLLSFGEQQGSEPGQFIAPHGVAVDSRGDLYVVDAFNHRIQKFRVLIDHRGGTAR